MLKEVRSNLSIQVCDNGYVVEYSGTLVDDTYKCFRVVYNTLPELMSLLEDLSELKLEHY